MEQHLLEGLIVQDTLLGFLSSHLKSGTGRYEEPWQAAEEGNEMDTCINTYQGEFLAPNYLTVPGPFQIRP